MAIPCLLIALAAGVVGAGEAAPGSVPAASSTPEAVPAAAPSAAVAEGLAKWGKRAAYAKQQAAGGVLDAASRKDLCDRLVKLDDVADGGADWSAITQAAIGAGLAPQGSSYAAALAALKAGGAVAATAPAAPVAPATASTTPATPAAVEKPAAPAKVFVPGARARLFVLAPGTTWPPVGLSPDLAPQASLRLPGIPDVKPMWVQRPNTPQVVPNHFLDNPAVDGMTYTAVEIVGHYFAQADGPVAIGVESNFPCTVEVADRLVTSTNWFPPLNQWVSKGYSLPNMIACSDGKVVATASGSTPALVAKRYYPVRVVVFQQWRASAKNDVGVRWSETMSFGGPEVDANGRALEVQGLGSRFKLRCTPPDAAGPDVMPLYTLEAKKTPKDE